VIDLSKYLNQVTLNLDNEVVKIGGGAVWADVDRVTSPAGYGAVGGTVSHVSPSPL
jgi:FAD/FMN-containing dehydrogenase